MLRRLLVLLVATLTACSTAPLRLEREDEPDRAAEYSALQLSGSEDPVRSLELAQEQARAMPRYSTAADSLREPRASGRIAADTESAPFATWRFLGPGNIGGRTRVLVIDPVQPDVMYTAGVSGGIWKTTTGGTRWTPIGDDLANIAVNSLVMHPTDRNVLFAGTGEGYFREDVRGTALPLRGNGIFVTRDAGETWTKLPSTDSPDFHFVNDLVISTHDPSRVYAATRTGVWRSRDGGTTWKRVLSTTVTGGCLDLAYRGDTDGDYLFAACGTFEQSAVWRSKNGETDAAWESVLSEPNMGRTTLAIAPSRPSVIYALAASNEPGRFHQGLLGLYRSDANGDKGSWTARTTKESAGIGPLLLTNVITGVGDICTGGSNEYVTMGWYCNTVAVDPTDPERVWAGGVDLFRSDDGGRNWGIASYWWPSTADSFVHADQHAIVFHPRYDGVNVKTAYFANDGGLFRTDDALASTATAQNGPCNPANSQMEFVDLNNGYGVTQFYHGAVSPDGRTFIAGAQDNGTVLGTIEAGPNAWTPVIGGDGGYVAIDPTRPDYMYGQTQWGAMMRSQNGGKSFRRILTGLQGETFLFISPFTLDPQNTNRLWLGGQSAWTSAGRGETWSRASAPMPSLVSALAVQPGNSDRVLAGTAGGHIGRTDVATKATSTTVWTLAQPRSGFVSSIRFDPTNANVVYATYAGFGGPHVWTSLDAGVTWTPIDGNLPDLPVHAIAIDPTRPERLYLGTDLGIFVSLDRGATWAVENTGFANAVTEEVVIGQGTYGPAVYAFTHGRGAWRAELVIPQPRRRAVR